MAKLKKIFSKQKQVIKTISMTSLDYKNLKSEEIMDRLCILNIYKLNIDDDSSESAWHFNTTNLNLNS